MQINCASGLVLSEKHKATQNGLLYFNRYFPQLRYNDSNQSSYLMFSIEQGAPNKRWALINAGSMQPCLNKHPLCFLSKVIGASIIILVQRKWYIYLHYSVLEVTFYSGVFPSNLTLWFIECVLGTVLLQGKRANSNLFLLKRTTELLKQYELIRW